MVSSDAAGRSGRGSRTSAISTRSAIEWSPSAVSPVKRLARPHQRHVLGEGHAAVLVFQSVGYVDPGLLSSSAARLRRLSRRRSPAARAQTRLRPWVQPWLPASSSGVIPSAPESNRGAQAIRTVAVIGLAPPAGDGQRLVLGRYGSSRAPGCHADRGAARQAAASSRPIHRPAVGGEMQQIQLRQVAQREVAPVTAVERCLRRDDERLLKVADSRQAVLQQVAHEWVVCSASFSTRAHRASGGYHRPPGRAQRRGPSSRPAGTRPRSAHTRCRLGDDAIDRDLPDHWPSGSAPTGTVCHALAGQLVAEVPGDHRQHATSCMASVTTRITSVMDGQDDQRDQGLARPRWSTSETGSDFQNRMLRSRRSLCTGRPGQ